MGEERIVIVGAGPAGCAAAVQCARLGVKPLLLDSSGKAGGLAANAFLVENYPGLEKPLTGEVLAGRLGEHLARFDVKITTQTVSGVEPDSDGWIVRTGGQDVRARCVILASGTVPRPLSIQGERDLVSRVLFYEVRDLLATIPSPKTIIVVGGGEAAFDYSLSLANAGASVSILVRSDRVRARGRLKKMVTDHPEISVELNTRLVVLEKVDAGVAATVISADRESLRLADALLAAVGRMSTASLIVSSQNPLSLTHAPGLFICGDARSDGLGQVGIAVGDGLAAAVLAVEQAIREKIK